MISKYFMGASPEYFDVESEISKKKHIEEDVKDFVISTEKYNKSNMKVKIVEYEIKD
ncbi:MAG: hypothetical protein KJ714_07650 [Euryarchaeota archaeon]|nr:hypothetical protein [Euryarchaeota archaeon]